MSYLSTIYSISVAEWSKINPCIIALENEDKYTYAIHSTNRHGGIVGGWKSGLLPETNFSRDVKKEFRKARKGDPRAERALQEVGTFEARQALHLARMYLQLGEVDDRSIRDHLRTAALASDKTSASSARRDLEIVADPKNRKKGRDSAEAALKFLKLRSEWNSLS